MCVWFLWSCTVCGFQSCSRLAEQYKEQSWITMSDLERELQEMEAQYEKEFRDGSDDEVELEEQETKVDKDKLNDETEEAEFVDGLYCPACDKLLKTEKAMKNHEKSKKHREMVALLWQQLEEEGNFPVSLDDADGTNTKEEEEAEDMPKQKLSKKQRKKQKTMMTYEESLDNSAGEEMAEEKEVPCMDKHGGSAEELVNCGQRFAASEDASTAEDVSQVIEATSEVKSSTKPKGKKAKDAKKSAKVSSEHPTMSEVPIHCVTCNGAFPSRNKLFEHLKATGHAKATQAPVVNVAVNARNKKEKRKNR
ncbi:dnaJ homolog subfamily C member 21-like [Porphyrio hochstetteri]